MTAHAMPSLDAAFPQRDILGASVASLERADAIGLLRRILTEKRFTKVSFLNAHNANIAWTDREFAEALRDFLILPDGIGVDIAAKLLYGSTFPANLNGTDFMPEFFSLETAPLTVGLLGTKRENAEAATETLSRLAPQHTFVFIEDGFFTREQERTVLGRIEAIRPDVLLVAMGVPRQELWIARNITERHCTMPVAVGALLDFLSGAVSRAPLWVRRMRMEWLYRLLLEPRRLWRRYVLGNPLFLARIVARRVLGGDGKR